MGRKLRLFLGSVAGLATITVLGLGGAYVYVGSAAQARLARTWPEVKGKDLPIPFPLTEAEVEALRQERLAQLAAAVPATPVATTPAAETATAAAVAVQDPLAGVDLGAIAMERAVARGATLVQGRLPCGECHGQDGAGKLVVDAQPVWTWYAPNITRGGKTKDYTPADWDRAVRHGIKKDGTTSTMPAVDFMSLSDQEVSDLAAYFQSLPAVDRAQPALVLGPVGKALIGLGKMPLSAELIDHGRTNPVLPPDASVSVEYGRHVAATCMGCHRTDYTGGPIAQGPPDWPPARNLTQAEDGLKHYSEEDFIRVLREAKRPDGTDVRPPMSDLAKMNVSDVELKAIYAFLKTLEARPTGQ